MAAVVLDDAAFSGHAARIDADGYTIVEDAIEPELVAARRDTIRRLESELSLAPRETEAGGHATLRMYSLLVRDPVFQTMPLSSRSTSGSTLGTPRPAARQLASLTRVERA